jgi:hypothetical protein
VHGYRRVPVWSNAQYRLSTIGGRSDRRKISSCSSSVRSLLDQIAANRVSVPLLPTTGYLSGFIMRAREMARSFAKVQMTWTSTTRSLLDFSFHYFVSAEFSHYSHSFVNANWRIS